MNNHEYLFDLHEHFNEKHEHFPYIELQNSASLQRKNFSIGRDSWLGRGPPLTRTREVAPSIAARALDPLGVRHYSLGTRGASGGVDEPGEQHAAMAVRWKPARW